MADVKISALPAATVPLAGTELVPIVQSGVTDRVTVDNLTAGRTVNTGALVVEANSSTEAVRINQLGSGPVLLIEDSANPDATPIAVDASGRLLVGTTTNVSSSTGVQVAQIGNNVTSPVIDFTKERAGTTVLDGQGLGTLRFWGYDGTDYRQAASITALVEGTPGTNVMPGLLQLRVRTATGTGDTPRLECLPWGGVTIGSQPGSGPALSGTVPAKLRIAEDTYTDTASAASATITTGTINSIQATAVAATNTGVTYTNLSTLFIQGPPAGSTNVTITNPWSLFIAAGNTYLGGNLGVGNAAPLNKLDVTGSFGRGAPVTKVASFTLAATENWVICNGTGTITVTLPAASSWTGREVMLKTIAAFTVVSASSNVVPQAGGAAGTAILAASAGAWATLVSDGTNWVIMQS